MMSLQSLYGSRFQSVKRLDDTLGVFPVDELHYGNCAVVAPLKHVVVEGNRIRRVGSNDVDIV